VIAENKSDLLRHKSSSDAMADHSNGRKTNHIVSLMQRFPFIQEQVRCSAKSGNGVDDIFKKAERHVFLFTFQRALCNVETGTLSEQCNRAISRIFRIFDVDHDNLLSDSEFLRFYNEAKVDGFDISPPKVLLQLKMPTIGDPSLKNDKITIAGFKKIFDFFCIEQNQNQNHVVWQIFRRYGYDDELNLTILNTTHGPLMDCWKLSSSAEKFLRNVFRQFDSDDDGILSPEDVTSIFSILPPPALPPWHPQRAVELFGNTFSRPKQSLSLDHHDSIFGCDESDTSPPALHLDSKNIADSTLIVPEASMLTPQTSSHFSICHTELSILSASDTLPSIDVGGMTPLSQRLSFLDWMGHWHALAAISGPITRAELYRLGFDKYYSNRLKDESFRIRNKQKSSIKKSDHSLPPYQSFSSSNIHAPLSNEEMSMKARVVRVLVLGKSLSGKTMLLNALCGAHDNKCEISCHPSSLKGLETAPTMHPETSATSVKICNSDTISRRSHRSVSTKADKGGKDFVVHLVFTDIPETILESKETEFVEFFGSSVKSTKTRNSLADIVLFVVDSTDISSFDFVKEWEAKVLLDDIPRLFVCTKFDEVEKTQESHIVKDSVYQKVKYHCEALDIEPPLLLSAADIGSSLQMHNHLSKVDFNQRDYVLRHISRCGLSGKAEIDGLRSRPHEEQKRKDSIRRRTMMWISGIAALAVAVGVGLLWGSNESKHEKNSGGVRGGGLGWLKKIFTYSRPSSLSTSRVNG
jgi:GTPase SAR1 family protein/Ca2+-binding EF-hand superfamily protein